MSLFDETDDATSKLRDFQAALEDATASLEKLEGSAGSAGGGGSGGIGGKKGGRGFKGLGKLAVGAVAAKAADDFLQGAMVTGSAGVGVGAANRGLISMASKIPIIGALTGASAVNQTLGRAENRVGGGLADMARQGLEVTDSMIQDELDIVIAQEKRATTVEARVRGISGQGENVAEATPDALVDGMANLVTLVEDIASSLKGITGGSAR